MAFVLELETSSSQDYTQNHLIAIIRAHGINASVHRKQNRIIAAFDAQNHKLQNTLEAIGNELGASCFLMASRHYEIEGEPDTLPEFVLDHPMGLGLCPACQKELFDPSSRRYYYPFTSCAHCGGAYAFFDHYPFNRTHSLMAPFHECVTCKSEQTSPGRHEQHHLISCHECGIAVRIRDDGNERYANDASSFRTLFEVAAKALRDGKTLLMKSTLGYRCFYLGDTSQRNSTIMAFDASKITQMFALIESEFYALLSIERPVLHVALKDDTLKTTLGFSRDVKYPDDGFNILLCKELERLGYAYIFYDESDAQTPADYVIDFDIPINTQKELRLFIDKERKVMVEGERVVFPSTMPYTTDTISIAGAMAGIKEGSVMRFDAMERFEHAYGTKVMVLEGEHVAFAHGNIQEMAADAASFMAVIAEHQKFGEKILGVCFEDESSLLYYDGKKVIRVVPPMACDASQLMEKIATLREGSDRLVIRMKHEYPSVYEQLENVEHFDLFKMVGVILELDDPSYEGVAHEALKFVGKGGLQVDTRVHDNRFDHVAFLASIISYKLAGVESVLLCYSIFESFGDYFSELLQELSIKTKSTQFVLCGRYFANASLYSRMMRNLKQNPPLLPLNYPLSKQSSVVGGVYL